MADKELRIRVGAAVDASLSTVFAQTVATAKAAQKAIQASAAQTARAGARAQKDGAKETEDALKSVGKTAKEQADAMAKDVARSANERVRAEKAAMKEVERDLARHTKEQDRIRNRAGGGSGGGSGARGNSGFGTIAGISYNRTPIKNDSLLLRGAGAATNAAKRFAGDALRGVGVETSMAARLQGAVERETLAQKISAGAWIPGGAGGKAAMTKVDPKILEAEAMQVGSATGTGGGDILEGLDKFVGLTGDLESARASMAGLAQLAKANNTEFADMMKGAATVSSSMGDIPDKGKAIVDVMRAIAGQGQLGALTMEEQAKYIGMISAQANNFKIDKTSAATLKTAGVESETGQRIAVINAMAQYARMKGGRITAKTADQSAMSFVADMQNAKERKNLHALGIETYTDKSHTSLADPNALMMEIFKKAKVKGGLDKTILKSAIPNQKSSAVIQSIAQDYQQTYDKTSGSDTEKHAAAIKMVTETMQGMLASTQSTAQITTNFGVAMNSTKSQVNVLNNQLGVAADDMAAKLLPVVKELTPAFLSVTGAIKGFVGWFAETTGISGLLGKQGQDTANMAAETRATNAKGTLKQNIGAGEWTEADKSEAEGAVQALQAAIASKKKEIAEADNGSIGTPLADARQSGTLDKLAASGNDSAIAYKRNFDQLNRMENSMHSLQSLQHEALVKALHMKPIPVVVATPPGAAPATGGTSDVNAKTGAN